MKSVRLTDLFSKASKQVPADETAKNAKLLIQAGYIHKEMAGVYAYLPLGKAVLDNITQIVREEMDAAGGQELQMTTLQPKEIWEKTDRWDDKKVDNWFKTKLASGSELGVGLTHEEPIIEMLTAHVNSYRDLPLKVYQIQNKFRNELRAKSGLMRGREFLMKDFYSFARNDTEHKKIYENMAKVYARVYDRLGIGDITYRTFASGGIFSKFSDEFQTISDVGEDTVYIHKAKRVGVNDEVCTSQVLEELGLDKKDMTVKKAVEVGNIFSLGSKYTDALGLYYSDENGKRQSVVMGCYGIGISRIMGLLAEHFADDKGLAWPESIAPAKVYLAIIGEDKEVTKQADQLYEHLVKADITTIYDDRDARAGEKFADADLLGIPYRVVVSKKTLEKGGFELKKRINDISETIDTDSLIKRLR